MIKNSIKTLGLLLISFLFQLNAQANTPKDNLSSQEEKTFSNSIHSLPLNPTFRFSVEKMKEGEKEGRQSNVLLPIPEQDAQSLSEIVSSTRDPFVEQAINSSNYAINFIKQNELSGLFRSNDDTFAIFRTKDGKEISYKTGQMIGKELKLTRISIENQFIELTNGSEKYRVKMKI